MKYGKKEYCENCNGILGYDCTYVIPKDKNSKGILTVEHWDGKLTTTNQRNPYIMW